MILLMFFMQLYDSFRVSLFKTLYRALLGVKCFFTGLRICPK